MDPIAPESEPCFKRHIKNHWKNYAIAVFGILSITFIILYATSRPTGVKKQQQICLSHFNSFDGGFQEACTWTRLYACRNVSHVSGVLGWANTKDTGQFCCCEFALQFPRPWHPKKLTNIFKKTLPTPEKSFTKENSKLIVAHYTEDLDWLKNQEFPAIVISDLHRHKTRSNEWDDWSKKIRDNHNDQDCMIKARVQNGNEASKYLQYIIDNYDNLPTWSIFVHGHRESWHHDGCTDDMMNNLHYFVSCYHIQGKKFLPLNNLWTYDLVNRSSHLDMYKYWYQPMEMTKEKGFPNILENDKIKRFANVSAQFIVHKDRIRDRSIDFWKKHLDFLATTEHKSFSTGRWYEWTWHVIFGEEWVMDYPKEFSKQLGLTYEEEGDRS